jgi:hypothetical protein
VVTSTSDQNAAREEGQLGQEKKAHILEDGQ